MNDHVVQLDTGDGSTVTVKRHPEDTVPLHMPTFALVRGIVQGDTSVKSIASFPFTDLGADFGKFGNSHFRNSRT